MEILISPVTGLVDRAVNKLINESKFCWRFNQHVEEFEDGRTHLIDALSGVQKDVETAKNAGEDIEENINTWQRDAKSLIEEDTKTKQKCFFNLCPNCIGRYLQGKDLAQKKVRIQELIGSSVFTKVGRPAKGPGIKFRSSPGYIDFESRKLEKKQLLDALADRSNYLIGLQGMGGCGKSHLVKKVGNEVENSEPKLFDRVIYVVVSSSPDFTEIRYDIGRRLGLKQEEGKELDPEVMYNRLTNGEKILIILDDVWEDFELREDIGIPNGEDHSGCCVLITSRKPRVCMSMGCQSLIKLKTLSKEDAWTLFKQRAALSDDFSSNFKKVGQEIVEECQSLPVAIAAIASSLKGSQSLDYWKSVLRSLKNAKPIENEKGLIKVYRSLELSYKYLKSNDAKKLFLLCSLFPEDNEIPIEDLIRFGIGLGLFGGDDDDYEILRDKVTFALAELIDYCLLVQVSQTRVIMHDLIRDVAHWIANQEIESIMGPRRNMVKRSTIRYLYCQKMDAFTNWLSPYIKLEFLSVSFDDRLDSVEIPKSFFECMEHLKVLQLVWQDLWCRHPSERKPYQLLPQSINLPENLRTLRVKGWELGAITFLENLEKLEMLELSDCSVNELPEGIVKLEKLKLLDLTNCMFKKNPWEVISRLSKIEELYFLGNKLNKLCASDWWNDHIGFLAELFDKNKIVPALHRYQIYTMSDRGSQYVSYPSEEDPTSRVLFVDYFPNFFSHATIIDWVRRAEILRLNKIQGGYRSVTPDLVKAIGDMNELIQLTLDSCPEIEYLINTTSTVSSQGATIFNKLAKLHLLNMGQLMELCRGTPPFDLFRELRKLSVFNCSNVHGRLFAKNLNLSRLEVLLCQSCPVLKSLFTLSTAKSLVQLRRLSLLSCHQLKDIIKLNEQEEEKEEEMVDYNHQQHIYGSLFPKLNVLSVWHSNQLEYIYPFSSVPALPSLMNVSLDRCRQLKYIVGPHPNKDPPLLQKDREVMLPMCGTLHLNDLPNFISIFPENGDPTLSSSYVEDDPGGRESEITALSGPRTPSSKCLGPSIQQLTFRNIREIKIYDCPKLISLLTSLNETVFLEVLRIQKCDALRQLVIDWGDYHVHIKQGSLFPKLKQLHVQDCKLLEFIFPVVFSGNPASLEKTTNKYDSQDVEQIVKENADDQIELRPHNQQVCFSSLAEVIVKNCGNLKWVKASNCVKENAADQIGIKHHNQQICFSSLAEISVKNCGNLKCLFSISTDSTFPELGSVFPKLEHLHVQDCKLLEFVFPVVFSGNPANLERTTNKYDSQDVEQIVKENADDQIGLKPHNQQVCFSSLAEIIVKNCGNLKCLFSISTDSTFPELQLLFVQNNLKLKQVFASERGNNERGRANKRVQVVLPKLKYLVLKELPSLDNNVFLGISLWNVERRIVKGCRGLSVSSTTTFGKLRNHFLYANNEFGRLRGRNLAELIGDEDLEDVESQDEEMVQSSEDTISDDSTSKDVETQVEEALKSEMPSSEPQTAKATEQGIVQQCLMSVSEEQLKEASIPSHQEINSIKEKGQESSESDKAMHKEYSEELRIACKDQQEHRKTTFDKGVGAESIMENVELVPTLEKVKVQRSSIPSEKRNSEQDPLITGPHETSAKDFKGNARVDPMSEESELRSPTPKSLVSLQNTTLYSVDETQKPTVLESPVSDLEPRKSTPGSTEEQFSPAAIEINKEGLLSRNYETITSIYNSDPRILPKDMKGSVEEAPATNVSKIRAPSIDSEPCSPVLVPLTSPLHKSSAQTIEGREEKIVEKSLASEKPTPTTLAFSLRETSHELVDGHSLSEPILKNQQPAHGETKITTGIPQRITTIPSEDESSIFGRAVIITPSTDSTGPLVLSDPIQKAISQDLCEFMATVPRSSDSITGPGDDLVAKVLADLEVCLEKPLKDIAMTEADNLGLETALNFLTSYYCEEGATPDRLKATIDSLQQEFPSILSSFKLACDTIEKFRIFEEKENNIKEEFALVSKITNTKKTLAEAEEKKANLKGGITRLQVELKRVEQEIIDCKTDLSSLEEEKKDSVVDSIGLAAELDNVKRNKPQMVQDHRKARQELLMADYKWLALCGQFRRNFVSTRILS